MAVPSVDTRVSGGCVHVLVDGEMIYEHQALLRERFEELLKHSEACIVVNLAGVGFCDSSGLNVLLDLRRQTEQNDRQLLLACVPASLRRILELTGSDQVLRIYDTVAEAEAACTAQP
ncbi:MAG: STAS domain-containing protein [Streptomyces sp.]|nr:STAS domain-containing protein [Streptomyces sp.]NUP61720.1 STAS domain-containing protein [Nonomuraea sp.]NUS12832.1 STAS domain-containing protein [Streptomyces sp.]NUS29986.1 STAS domain-containing protein [Streptomyces sp.]